MSTSMNGWPVLQYGSSLIIRGKIPDCAREVNIRGGSAGFLMLHFLTWFDKKIEPLDEGIYDDWGHAVRPVRGQTSGYSNHASATAVDANATKHPLGVRGTFAAFNRAVRIRAKLLQYRGCIRWGGDYTGRADEMHFEINRNLATCEARAKALINTKVGKKVLEKNPGMKAVIYS